MTSTQKEYGQYFTISDELQQHVFDLVKHKNELLLEPSFGAGHLLTKFLQLNKKYPMDCYELDKTIKPVVKFNKNQTIKYGDFTKEKITKKYKTIIGNPPYVKQKTGNLYLKFIELCFNYLDKEGELIFIVPSDFIKLTKASKLIKKMLECGSFTHFYFPNKENLFEEASIDVCVFRYQKDLKLDKVMVNDEEKYLENSDGIITFIKEKTKGKLLSELFDVYVGIVSGRDEIYKVDFGNIEVLVDKNKKDKFIYTDTFPTNDKKIDKHLTKNKSKLLERRIKKFNEKNWFQWGAPRNKKKVEANLGKDCIYIKNVTRSKEVAFIDKVQLFGGSLLCLIPKKQIEQTVLLEIVQHLNSETFQKNYIYSGRFKIGHKQVQNISISLV
jgi:adenine-specific DNA-methyltransferase